MVEAGSNLLSSERKDQWDDLPQGDQQVAATRLLTAVEKSGFKVANTIKAPLRQPIVNIQVNISESCFCLLINNMKLNLIIEGSLLMLKSTSAFVCCFTP